VTFLKDCVYSISVNQKCLKSLHSQKHKSNSIQIKFVKDKTEARLKVSFFKPIWAGYNVIDIDEEYQYALVAGSSLKYLWILSRTTTIPESIKQRFLEKAKKIGYNTDELIWVKHNQ